MSSSIARDETASASAAWRPPTLGSVDLGLLARHGEWVRRLDDAARLAELEPRLARDIGAAPCADRRPEGFGVYPRPLWGVGLAPQPVHAHSPPWSVAATERPPAAPRSRPARGGPMLGRADPVSAGATFQPFTGGVSRRPSFNRSQPPASMAAPQRRKPRSQ
jgi:hypothetical protein